MKTEADIKKRYTNLDYLRQRTKSDSKLMKEMIIVYLDLIPPMVSIMTQSVKDKNYDLLQSTVHKMIPSFSIVGLGIEYENMAKMVQDCARMHDATGQISGLVKKLEIICTQACEELKEELNIIKL